MALRRCGPMGLRGPYHPGGMRVIVLLSWLLCSNWQARRRKYIVLEDNFPCAASVMKGRSPSPSLIFLLRKKAAHCLASEVVLLLPWVESELQPADASLYRMH